MAVVVLLEELVNVEAREANFCLFPFQVRPEQRFLLQVHLKSLDRLLELSVVVSDVVPLQVNCLQAHSRWLVLNQLGDDGPDMFRNQFLSCYETVITAALKSIIILIT